jgi:hypothetical protein
MTMETFYQPGLDGARLAGFIETTWTGCEVLCKSMRDGDVPGIPAGLPIYPVPVVLGPGGKAVKENE